VFERHYARDGDCDFKGKDMSRKILVIANYLIGDSLQTIYAYNALKKKYDDAVFHIIAPEYSKGVFDLIDKNYIWEQEISEVFYPFYFDGKNLLTVIKQAWKLRHKFEIVIVFPGGFGAALYAWLLGGLKRAGSATDGRGFLLTDKVASNDGQYTTTQYFNAVVDLLDCDTASVSAEFYGADIDTPLPDNYIVVAPMSSVESRIWSFDHYYELIEILKAQFNLTPIIIGSPSEREKLAPLSKQLGAIDLVGKLSIPQVFTLVDNARFYIGAYSGVIYISALTNTPTFAITGPSDPYGTLPATGNVFPIFKEKLDENGNILTDSHARNDVDVNLIQVSDVLKVINDKLETHVS
jgi:ADP-heptose:LPS heptosyltransferase